MSRYIDADKLANDIYRAWELWEKKGEDCYIFAEVITPMLVGQPTADVRENVKGEWISLNDGRYKCSHCGMQWKLIGTPEANGMNYCLNCGAEMRL